MTAQGGAGVVCVEHASDRDAVAGISEHGCGGADGAACLSRVPFLRAIVSCPAELDGACAGVVAVPAGPGGCQTGRQREVRS